MGGTLRAAVSGTPNNLDPGTYSLVGNARIFGNIFSNLIEVDPDGNLYGVLATKWSSPDPKTYVFDLVDNAFFHNGEKFTSADVKYTFERIIDPDTASPQAALFRSIASIDTPSPTQVVFNLSNPSGPFLINVATQGWIVNQKAIETLDPVRQPIGTGPFEFVEWVQGDHITLKRNDNYFRSGLPYLDEVIFSFLNVDESRMQALRAGQIDWIDAIPLQNVATIQSDPDLTYVTASNAGIPDYLAFNNKKAPFDNKLLRQAVSWAIDRQAILDIAYYGTGERGVEEVPSRSIFYDGVDPFASGPDLEKAKALMAQAGYPDGGLTIEFIGEPQFPELFKTGEIVQQQLIPLGIDVTITSMDESVWLDRFSKGDYQMLTAFRSRTIHPDTMYSGVLRTGSPLNWTGYSNPDVDVLIDAAVQESDPAKARSLYQEIRAKIAEDAPLLFTHYETLNYLMRKNVVGSTVVPTLAFRFELVGFSD